MNPKRQHLLDTALDLFYKNGINSIGINEVLKVSGVAKRTLYSHFESKDALILAVLEQRHNTFMSWLEGKLAGTSSNQEVIEQLFVGLSDWFNNQEAELGEFRGCFFINTSAEFADLNSEIACYCSSHKRQVKQLISQHLHSDNDKLLNAICIMKEGAIISAYMTGNGDDIAQQSIEVLKSMA